MTVHRLPDPYEGMHPKIPRLADNPGPDEFRIDVVHCANCGADFMEHEIGEGKILCPKARTITVQTDNPSFYGRDEDCPCQTAGPHLCPTDDRPFVALDIQPKGRTK